MNSAAQPARIRTLLALCAVLGLSACKASEDLAASHAPSSSSATPSAARSASTPTPTPSPLTAPPTAAPISVQEVLEALDRGNSLAALRALEALVLAHPGQTRLVEMRDQLRASFAEALARAVLEPESPRRLGRGDIPAADNVVTHATHLRRFRALAESKDAREAAALLDEVRALQEKHPDFVDGWLLQARLALLLERAPEGRAAGARLAALRAWEIVDASTIRLLEALDQQNWLPRPLIPTPRLPDEAITAVPGFQLQAAAPAAPGDALARIQAALGRAAPATEQPAPAPISDSPPSAIDRIRAALGNSTPSTSPQP